MSKQERWGKSSAFGLSKRAIIEKFSSEASQYARHREDQIGFIQQREIVLPWLPRVPGRALELGCGAVGLFVELERAGWEVVGVDISRGMLRHARDRARSLDCPRVRFVQGDAELLSFVEGTFDVVVLMGVLEYLSGDGPALRQARRVLRPGGRLILSVPLRHSPYAWGARAFRALPLPVRRVLLRRPRGTPLHRIDPRGCRPRHLKRSLAQHGFQILNRAYAHFEFFPLDKIFPRLSRAMSRWIAGRSMGGALGRLGSQYLVNAFLRHSDSQVGR